MDHAHLREEVNKALKVDILQGLSRPRLSYLSSGSLLLNYKLSGNPFNGYAWGRTVEVFGPEGTGKTTLALHAVKEAQQLEKATKKPFPVLYIDVEHALDVEYAKNIGVMVDPEHFSQAFPYCAEDALGAMEKGIQAGYRLIVLDSVAALLPRAELEGRVGDSFMGLQARLMGQTMRKVTGTAAKAGVLLFFINQIRMKIGVMFGNPETTSGGNALKFYSTYRIDMRAPAAQKQEEKSLDGDDGTNRWGQGINLKIIKNKVYPPYKVASVVVRFGHGIDRARDLVAVMKTAGIRPKIGYEKFMKLQGTKGWPQAEAQAMEKIKAWVAKEKS